MVRHVGSPVVSLVCLPFLEGDTGCGVSWAGPRGAGGVGVEGGVRRVDGASGTVTKVVYPTWLRNPSMPERSGTSPGD